MKNLHTDLVEAEKLSGVMRERNPVCKVRYDADGGPFWSFK
jgi:hypothetical protein